MRAAAWILCSLSVWAGCAGACRDAPPGTGKGADVEFARCDVVEVGPRCRLGADRSLVLWSSEPGPLRAVSREGAAISLDAQAIGGGTRYRLKVPCCTRELRVLNAAGASLLVLPLLEPDVVPELVEAQRLRDAGELAAARGALETFIAASRSRGDDRHAAAAQALLPRISLELGRHEQALVEFEASLARALTAHQVSTAMLAGCGLAFVQSTVLKRYADARQTLARIEAISHTDATSRAMLIYNRGLVALESGNIRPALADVRDAAVRFARLDHRYAAFAREQEARVLAILGRTAEAVSVQRDLVHDYSENLEPCAYVDRQESVVWYALMAGVGPDSDVGRQGVEASRTAEKVLERCPAPNVRRNHWSNAAMLALHAHDLPRASAALQELAQISGDRTAESDGRQCELQGRYKLALGDLAGAKQAFECALDRARRDGLWELDYLALLGLARSHGSEPQLALASYREAERLQDELLERVPVSEGRAGFQHTRARGTVELMELLLSLGRPAEALDVARRARARVLTAITRASRIERLDAARRASWETAVARYRQARSRYEMLQAEAWRLPQDQLADLKQQLMAAGAKAHAELDAVQAALGESALVHASQSAVAAERASDDEALLAYFPGSAGLHAFAVRGGETREITIADFDAASTGALTTRLVLPFEELLRGAVRLRVLMPDTLGLRDLHALELAGAPLVERWPVVYSLDIPSVREAREQQPLAALIVANPDRTLPRSEVEGREVLRALPGAELLVGASGSRAKVLTALLGRRHFHFAGHARHAGIEGIDSSLVLADGELSVGDILTLGGGPESVVLSACEAAKGGGGQVAQSMGLAQAFVVQGARSVVAASRTARDDTAREFSALYYAALAGLHDRDAPVIAWRRAVLELRARGRPDWSVFRVLVP